MFPALAIMTGMKYLEGTLSMQDLIAVGIVLGIFLVPILLNMAFGGGDLRFGAFCALFVGLQGIGFFILFSGLLHVAILKYLKKRSFAFAPAMSIAALLAYGIEKSGVFI